MHPVDGGGLPLFRSVTGPVYWMPPLQQAIELYWRMMMKMKLILFTVDRPLIMRGYLINAVYLHLKSDCPSTLSHAA